MFYILFFKLKSFFLDFFFQEVYILYEKGSKLYWIKYQLVLSVGA